MPLHSPTLQAFLRFALVGCVGFVVDFATLCSVVALGANPYWGRIISFLLAATCTWAMNRAFTFNASRSKMSWPRQWLAYLMANSLGAAVSFGVYSLILYRAGNFGAQTAFFGVGFGSLSGLLVNFSLSHFFVFGADRPKIG